MKSVALGILSGLAVVAVAAVPASASTTAHSPTRTPVAAAAAASTWHPGIQRPAAHRTAARAAQAASPVSTTRLIIRAVERSGLLGELRPNQVSVSAVRVSRIDPTWAAAKVTPKDPNRTDPADVVLRKVKGTWKAVDLGTAEVGCGLVRDRVITSLGLTCD